MAPEPLAVHATAGDLDRLALALSAAFRDDPVQRWLFAGAPDVDAAFDRFFRFFAEEYFALGHVYVLRDDPDAGAALWAPPDRGILHGDRVDALISLVQSEIGDHTVPRLTELARSAEYRPAEPHFYLGILGVPATHRGAGLGGVLVEPVLAMCDRAGIPAHLESSNPRNLGFYERLGFAVTDEYRCGGEPLMTIMTRPPQ